MDCPVCAAEAEPKTLAGFEAFKCECGFIFAAPGANSSAPSLYDESWSKQVVHPTYAFANGQYLGRNTWKQEDLLKRLEPFRKVNRILDVGCSAAFFLRLAKDRGWNVQGVEVAEWAATFSREKLGVPIFQGMLQDAAFPDASFDVAFSSHVLEHIEQPREFIREMHRVIRPGGALVIVVPTQFRSPLYVSIGQWFGEGPPRHVSFFNRRSLSQLFTSTGFTNVRCSSNVELQPIVRKIRGRRPAPAQAQAAGAQNPTHAVEQKPGLVIRAIKSAINGLSGRFDIEDEIEAVAVRR